MKQVVQDIGKGGTLVLDVPQPALRSGHLLIRTRLSLISAGTERMLVDFGRSNYLQKARQQPERVREVLNKVRTDGLATTVEAVRSKLEQPLPMGYSNVGVVEEIGEGVDGFAVGDRVVSNGHHAEFVCVARNLCAKIPDYVDDSAAAFTVLGAVALQGIRLIAPSLGECVFVSGLGLIGLMAVQILRANGCRVLGADFDPTKLALAKSLGAEIVDLSLGTDPVLAAMSFSRGIGMDAVLVTASTKSSEPITQAAHMSRKRGRIVLVGVTGLELNRADFYEKELTFQVSCSYGPGRYDPSYEQYNNDYPVGFVRWTEQRNFEAVLELMASDAVDTRKLISKRVEIGDAATAYDALVNDRSGLGILLEYPDSRATPTASPRTVILSPSPRRQASSATEPVIAAIGSGNYAGRVLLPAFAKAGAHLKTIASAKGLSGTVVARKLGFEHSTTDLDAVFGDPQITAVVIGTQHDSHAHLVIRALEAGKSVFVEKPLCLTLQQLAAIEAAYSKLLPGTPLLMVGFNRRFAPMLVKAKSLLAGLSGPKSFIMTVNAGAIPSDHWTQNSHVGGGRIVGEACHFIDLLRDLAASPIVSVHIAGLAKPSSLDRGDTVAITLKFADGSFGTINYFANGHKAFPKERLEVFCAGRILQLDNFRRLKGYGWPNFSGTYSWRQDKGQSACVAAFMHALRTGGMSPIDIREIFEVSRISIEAAACTA